MIDSDGIGGEDLLIAKIERKRRESLVRAAALGLSLVTVVTAGVAAYAAHASGVATRTAAISLNAREIASVRALVERIAVKSGGHGKMLVELKTDIKYIKATLDELARRQE